MRSERTALPPKAILFDLDGTLFDRESSYLELVHAQYEHFAEMLAHIPRELYIERAVELDAHGYVERSVVYGGLAREFEFPSALAEDLARHFWDTYHLFGRAYPEVPSALAGLRSLGLKLGIITNGSVRMQERKIQQLGLPEMFDAVLISEREGVRKPDSGIFERALTRLGVTAGEAWFVGDHPAIDVQGAFEAGLTPVWRYTAYWQPREIPAQEIRGLDELVSLLERSRAPYTAREFQTD